MTSKRKAGRIAHKVAKKVYRKSIRKPKRAVVKLYASKCGKSTFKKLTGRKTKSGRKVRRRRKRY